MSILLMLVMLLKLMLPLEMARVIMFINRGLLHSNCKPMVLQLLLHQLARRSGQLHSAAFVQLMTG